MINTTNLIQQKINFINQNNKNVSTAYSPKVQATNLLEMFLNNRAVQNISIISTPVITKPYKNNLRTLFNNNEAKILAIIPRTFNAKDINGNEYIDGNEVNGTFLNAIERLDEVKAQGFNTLHLLPINPPGKTAAKGTAGSVYAPQDLLKIDPMLIDKNDPRSDKEQFKAFIDECHKRDIKVMIDLPSCASVDLYNARPDIMAKERDGMAKTPQGWQDIRMFQPWEDEGKRTLSPKLLELHKQFIDMCIDLGADGIRADVARAKPVEFWDILIPYSRKLDSEFGWLGETYTYEDASPQTNMPFDRPEDTLRAGFDVIYGQYHIFNELATASEFMNYVKEQLELSARLDKGKSLIGSFATHDDKSPMYHGKTDYCNLTSGLQATLPMLNPYIVDGFQSGDYYAYPYENKHVDTSYTDKYIMETPHRGYLDIFNLSRKPGGKNPEIGEFMTACFKLKDDYANIINKGSFIEFEKKEDTNDQIIAYARHYYGKTLLVVANKNMNRVIPCKIKIPGLKGNQELKNLLPKYGQDSKFQVKENELCADVGAGRIHVFEIDTPSIEEDANEVYRQNL